VILRGVLEHGHMPIPQASSTHQRRPFGSFTRCGCNLRLQEAQHRRLQNNGLLVLPLLLILGSGTLPLSNGHPSQPLLLNHRKALGPRTGA
jgi:hypothetical protein